MASFRRQGMLVWAHYFRNVDKGLCFFTIRFIDILIHSRGTLISQATVLTLRPPSKCMHRLQNLALTRKKGRGLVPPYLWQLCMPRGLSAVTEGEGVSWIKQPRSCHPCMVKVTERGGGFQNLLGTCWHQEGARFGMTFTYLHNIVTEWQYWATTAHVSEKVTEVTKQALWRGFESCFFFRIL